VRQEHNRLIRRIFWTCFILAIFGCTLSAIGLCALNVDPQGHFLAEPKWAFVLLILGGAIAACILLCCLTLIITGLVCTLVRWCSKPTVVVGDWEEVPLVN